MHANRAVGKARSFCCALGVVCHRVDAVPAVLFATVAEDISEMFTKFKVELYFSLEAAPAGSLAKRVWGAP